MSLPVEKEIREALEPYNKCIRKVLDKAFRDFLAKRGAGNLYKRTDSADVFDRVIRSAIAEFTGKPGIQVFSGGSTARFLFGGRVLVRFKKAARRGRGSNIQTGANDNFLDPAIPFADAPHAMKVEICWKVNDLGTGYTSRRATAQACSGATKCRGARRKSSSFRRRPPLPSSLAAAAWPSSRIRPRPRRIPAARRPDRPRAVNRS
jgi:hypothetical protein